MDNRKNTVDEKVKEWLEWDLNEDTRKEVEELVEKEDYSRLEQLLCNRMEFGTAGLRATMGAGYSRMNDLTIIQTAQGFSEYMLQSTPDVKQKGVIIGYDARHNSRRFAELTACVLLNQAIPVYLFSKVCPTPFVAFGVLHKGCSWGVMVTASHNPKQDNGFKVYFSNGAQIISPHDKEISKHILGNLEPRILSWKTEILNRSMILKDPFEEVYKGYYEALQKLSFQKELNASTSMKFTYTAMHGVGFNFFLEAFQLFKFKHCVPVVEQVQPDPEFPTVKYPNPEEGKSALDLAIQTANNNDSNVILANDPDADRLAVAEKLPSGDWHTFTGNELGALIGWWLIQKHKESHDASIGHCLASTVSSKMLKRICQVEGVSYEETLTGFKYMGNVSCQLLAQGRKVIFAYEEAIGYMCGSSVLDKDGISAAVVLAEVATWCRQQQHSLHHLLMQLYDTYGYHTSLDSYYLCDDKSKIKKIFDRIRQLGTEEVEWGWKYPNQVGGHKVQYIRDLHTGFDNQQNNNTAIFPVSKSSHMVTFTFLDLPVILTLRTSGTEPKIKYYSEYCAQADSKLSREEVRRSLGELVGVVLEELLQPKLNQLQAKQ